MPYTTLVDSATLAAHLQDPQWVMVDCRHDLANPEAGAAAYGSGHLPGAVFLHLDRDLSGPKTGCNGRHPLPAPEKLVQCLEAVGIGDGTQVVAYDDCGGMMAGRLWWLLRWLGHDRVALLDGGLQAWLGAGQPLATDNSRVYPVPTPGRLTAAMRNWVVEVEDVLAGLGSADRLIVDARSPDRFRGENESIDPMAGHIPGARNRFFRNNLDGDGRFKASEELRRDFLALFQGVPPEQVVHQCGSGVSACHNLLAMEIAGLSGSRLYAGSWSEWCADPERPVEK
ncbi:MAG: sulfurtransferase [Betaproteobacteria bacterium]|nr:sulfurtransferase [Betaproteobacteria bacterium]